MRPTRLIFVGTFFLVLFAQLTIWRFDSFTDQNTWVRRVVQLSEDLKTPTKPLDLRVYSEHPGTTILLPAAAAYRLGLSATASLKLSVSVINALVIGLVAVLAYKLSPRTIFWAAIAGMVAWHPLNQYASPVDAVFGPLAVAMTLFFLKYARGFPKQTSHTNDLVLAAGIGISLATRFHVAVVLLALPMLLLWRLLGSKRWLIVLGLSLVVAVILTPLLWAAPFAFIKLMLQQVGFFTGTALDAKVSNSLGWEGLLFMPLAILSILLSLVVYRIHALPQFIGRPAFLALLLNTALTAGLLLLAHLQSLRYFFPLIFIWEALLPLWLLRLYQFKLDQSMWLNRSPKNNNLLPALGVLILSASQIFLLGYSLIQASKLS